MSENRKCRCEFTHWTEVACLRLSVCLEVITDGEH